MPNRKKPASKARSYRLTAYLTAAEGAAFEREAAKVMLSPSTYARRVLVSRPKVAAVPK